MSAALVDNSRGRCNSFHVRVILAWQCGHVAAAPRGARNVNAQRRRSWQRLSPDDSSSKTARRKQPMNSRGKGVPAAQVTMFYSNPPGQHAAYPIAEEQREHAGGN